MKVSPVAGGFSASRSAHTLPSGDLLFLVALIATLKGDPRYLEGNVNFRRRASKMACYFTRLVPFCRKREQVLLTWMQLAPGIQDRPGKRVFIAHFVGIAVLFINEGVRCFKLEVFLVAMTAVMIADGIGGNAH